MFINKIQNPLGDHAKCLFLSLSTIVCVLLTTQPVASQSNSGLQRYTVDDGIFNLKFLLGLGGEIESEADGTQWDTDEDLEPSLGGGIEVDFPLHKFFLLGGMFGFTTWITENGSDEDLDRGYLLDIAIVPKVRFPFEDTILAIYLGVPIGLCIDLIDEDNFPGIEDVDTGIGFGLNVLGGLQVNFSRAVGFMVEFGYTYHSFSHDFETVSIAGFSDEIEVDSSMDQFALNLGLYFLM